VASLLRDALVHCSPWVCQVVESHDKSWPYLRCDRSTRWVGSRFYRDSFEDESDRQLRYCQPFGAGSLHRLQEVAPIENRFISLQCRRARAIDCKMSESSLTNPLRRDSIDPRRFALFLSRLPIENPQLP
jgi:hypothetical protein